LIPTAITNLTSADRVYDQPFIGSKFAGITLFLLSENKEAKPSPSQIRL
jgi:hypothetical protein